MRGPAGVGKSAIAQTCAEGLKESGHLGAAFFFSINGRNNPRRFFPTLAYQLSTLFPDLHDIVNDRVYRDKTLVRKRMSSQFTSLIVEPLYKTTPFRWAIFSRPEPHIKSTFDKGSIARFCRRVLLPVSREADGEIETYLKGGFTNILLRRDLLSLSDLWPTKEDIQILVEASAGLFAYPAAVLRFVDCHSLLEFRETLQAVLAMINACTTHSPKSMAPFAKLDALYMLLMERIPADTLPAVQVVLTYMFISKYDTGYMWYVAVACNILGLSETSFKGICHRLSAVLEYRDSPIEPDLQGIDITRSFHDQDIPSRLRMQLGDQSRKIYGLIHLHHKSFYDFLIDPTRSSTFCVKTPAILEKYFNHLTERHHRFAQGLDICDSNGSARLSLVPAPGSPPLLSWPHQSELVNSYLHIVSFHNLHYDLDPDGSVLSLFLDNIGPSSLQKLAVLDYRKPLIADILRLGAGLHWPGETIRVLYRMTYYRFEGKVFERFNWDAFLPNLEKLEKLNVIKPYHSNFLSAITSIPRVFSQRGELKKASRRYRMGHGNKAIYWYWEFDLEQKYSHSFYALDFEEAMKIYETEKFKMWEDD
ncbi:hypothetical protein AN958_11079 [Leucoagaricus sp. SymC.cos]|nr:hypothetical protein AN958_11079 [Leucoagaricus sp. SymC.cos]